MPELTSLTGATDPESPTATAGVSVPAVLGVRRDAVHREIRLELAEWRTRTGGVYDLPEHEQEALMLPGHLPHWGDFLPDFVIVYATGDPTTASGPDGTVVESVVWRDLKVHAGGVQRDAVANPEYRRGVSALSASAEWNSLDALLGRRLLPYQVGAPTWLLDLLREQTPWGPLLDNVPR